MRLPASDASHIRLVNFGLYTVGRLTRKKQTDLAGPIKDSSLNILALGRACEDAGLNTQQGFADRDAIDEDLAPIAQRIRKELANRDLGAERQAPYTAIFPDGIAYYTEAPLGELESRYQLLISRLEANLAEDDRVRTEYVPQIKSLLEAFRSAVTALEALENEETLARDRLSAARSSWEKLLNDSYATLCQRYDKRQAEQFFRKFTSASRQAG